jgi:hypothetical protein
VRLAAAQRFFAAREILLLPSDVRCLRLLWLAITCGFFAVPAADSEFILAFARMTDAFAESSITRTLRSFAANWSMTMDSNASTFLNLLSAFFAFIDTPKQTKFWTAESSHRRESTSQTYFPPSRLGCGRLRCHSLISDSNSLFLVSLGSVASCRSSSAMRPAAKSGRPDFFFGFSTRIAMTPLLTVSHEDERAVECVKEWTLRPAIDAPPLILLEGIRVPAARPTSIF